MCYIDIIPPRGIYCKYTIKLNEGVDNSGQGTIGTDDQLVSETGVRWHTELAIIIKYQAQALPPDHSGKDIGTQDSSGKIHWGPSGRVNKIQLRLGNVFQTWGQPFSPSQILINQNGSEGTVSMTVNGQPNTEFENYVIKDGDRIEIR